LKPVIFNEVTPTKPVQTAAFEETMKLDYQDVIENLQEQMVNIEEYRF
jgi:hypothetical protein